MDFSEIEYMMVPKYSRFLRILERKINAFIQRRILFFRYKPRCYFAFRFFAIKSNIYFLTDLYVIINYSQSNPTLSVSVRTVMVIFRE